MTTQYAIVACCERGSELQGQSVYKEDTIIIMKCDIAADPVVSQAESLTRSLSAALPGVKLPPPNPRYLVAASCNYFKSITAPLYYCI